MYRSFSRPTFFALNRAPTVKRRKCLLLLWCCILLSVIVAIWIAGAQLYYGYEVSQYLTGPLLYGGVDRCAQRFLSNMNLSNDISGTVKPFLSLVQSVSERSRREYLRSLSEQPLRLNTAEEVMRSLKPGSRGAKCRDSASGASPERVAICAIQSTMGPFLQEWIMHNLLLGVQKIVFLSNSDEWPWYTAAALRPFVEAGFVEIAEMFAWTFPQIEFYHSCFRTHASEFDWIGFIDVDEYILPYHNPNNDSSVRIEELVCLPDFLSSYKDKLGLVLPWRLMHSTPVTAHDFSMLFLEQYRYFTTFTPPLQRPLIKSFANARIAAKYGVMPMDQHNFAVTLPELGVNVLGIAEPNRQMTYYNGSDYYQYAEVRHFWGNSWSNDIYLKVCGRSAERQKYQGARIDSLIESVMGVNQTKVEQTAPAFVKVLRKSLQMPG